MEEIELKNFLIGLDFGIKMNDIEKTVYEKRENKVDNGFHDYTKKYHEIFEQYCTNKKRVYGGKADSYGIPTRYNGIEQSIEKSTTIKNRNRAEVYFRTDNDFKAEYLFVVLRKNNLWRIDSVKYKWWNNEKWNAQIL